MFDNKPLRVELVSLALGMLLAVSLCLGITADSEASAEVLTVSGSTTLQPVLVRIAREFMKDHPGSSVSVRGGGSGQGFAALFNKTADIASSSRFLTHSELDLAYDQRIYLVPFRIADDCIIPITHKTNNIRNLSREQLRRVFAGEISNWRSLGGANQPIKLIARSRESGTRGAWSDMVMERQAMATNAVSTDSSADTVRMVSSTPGAIGYISLGHLSASVKPLRVDGVMGSLYTARDGSYPLSRPLFLFTRGWPEDELLLLINYTLRPDKGQSIIQKMGLVPLYQRLEN